MLEHCIMPEMWPRSIYDIYALFDLRRGCRIRISTARYELPMPLLFFSISLSMRLIWAFCNTSGHDACLFFPLDSHDARHRSMRRARMGRYMFRSYCEEAFSGHRPLCPAPAMASIITFFFCITTTMASYGPDFDELSITLLFDFSGLTASARRLGMPRRPAAGCADTYDTFARQSLTGRSRRAPIHFSARAAKKR